MPFIRCRILDDWIDTTRYALFMARDVMRGLMDQLKSLIQADSILIIALHKACPIRITKVLTDNGKEFTDRLFANQQRWPTGDHAFDQRCTELASSIA